MSDYRPKTADELRTTLLRSLTAVLPQISIAPGSLARLEACAIARIVADLHVRINALDRDLTPLRATERGLGDWATVLRVPRRGAVGATRSQALEVRGKPGRVIPAGAVLRHRTQQLYRIPSAVTIPEAGVTLADVEAIDAGAGTNLAAGESLRFDEPPAEIEPGARLILDLVDGVDIEPLGQWRARIVSRFQAAAQGGNRDDYKAWIFEAQPAAASAFVYANKPTEGSVSIAGLRAGSGAVRALTRPLRDTIASYIAPRRPITDRVVVLETVPRPVHVDMRIQSLPLVGFDWDDTDTEYTVASYDPNSAELQIGPGVPPTLAAGDLLTIASASPDAGADGFPAVVSAVKDATTAVLAPFGGRSRALNWQPLGGERVHAYSATADRVRTAILGGYTLGCEADAEAFAGLDTLGPANPEQRYGEWLSDLRVDRLQAAALSVPGVVRVEVVTPSKDVAAREFSFPDDHKVELLIPGQIIVRGLP